MLNRKANQLKVIETLNDNDLEEDKDFNFTAMYNITISPDSLCNEYERSQTNESVVRKISFIQNREDLENIDETKVYTAVELELLKTLMKVL